jgi:uncharacterized membrane protein
MQSRIHVITVGYICPRHQEVPKAGRSRNRWWGGRGPRYQSAARAPLQRFVASVFYHEAGLRTVAALPHERTMPMPVSPLIAIHIFVATAATLIGPVALWARKGGLQRPQLHRAFGYAWIAFMLATALTAVFIRDFRLPNVNGYTPIHLLVPFVVLSLFRAFRRLAQHDIAGHRRIMQRLYVSGCLVAGLLTLLPSRQLGRLLASLA